MARVGSTSVVLQPWGAEPTLSPRSWAGVPVLPGALEEGNHLEGQVVQGGEGPSFPCLSSLS